MMSALTIYAMIHQTPIPQPMAQALASISVTYKKHANTQSRICSDLIESQAHRFANRSAYDVFYLAAEFARNCCDHSMVRSIVKLYRQRTMVTPQLAMPARVEDAVVRVMTPGKVADGTKDRAIQSCAP